MTLHCLYTTEPALRGAGLITYDDSTGEVVDKPCARTKNGVCRLRDDIMYAFYVEEDALFFQVGPNKINLDRPDTSIYQMNDYDTGTTLLRLSQGHTQLTIRYTGWWVGIINPPEGAAGLPELDEEEDRFRFIADLLSDADYRNLFKEDMLRPVAEPNLV